MTMKYVGGDMYHVIFERNLIPISGEHLVEIAASVLDNTYLKTKLSLVHKLSDNDSEFKKQIKELKVLVSKLSEDKKN